jgi:hypothetical protein
MSTNATLGITFEGLMIFTRNDNARILQVGALKNIPGHEFRVEVENDDPPPPAGFDAALSSSGDITIEVTGEKDNNARSQQAQTFARGGRAGLTEAQEKDFRWLVDLEGNEFHNRPLSWTANYRHFLGPIITVKHGEFYTKDLRDVRITSPRAGRTDVAVARIIGCKITIPAKESAVLTYGLTGHRRELRFPHQPGHSYVMRVINNIPEAEEHGMGHEQPRHDFRFYYNLLNVPANEQFNISSPDAATARWPCDGIFLGRKQGLP